MLSVFRISTALRSVELTLDEAAATAAAVAGLVVMAETKLAVELTTGVVGPLLGGTDVATLVATSGAILGEITESAGLRRGVGVVSASSNLTKLSSSSLDMCSEDNSSLLSATKAEFVAKGEARL